MRKVVIAILMLSFFTQCSHYRDDNYIEEIIEELIERHTGEDVDLSPSSPENKV